MVVDDEPLARERLVRLLEQCDAVTGCISADNGREALEKLSANPVDLVLLDIRMPGLSGLDVARQLSQSAQPPAIVFCTAYDDYALEAFEVQAVAYLLKPIKRDALMQALRQTRRLNRAQLNALVSAEDTPVLVVQTGRGRERIPLTDIFYFRAEQKYVMAQCRQGERVCDLSLKQLEERWPQQLVRIHRHTLVVRSLLERLTRDSEGGFEVHLRGLEKPLIASRRYARELKSLFSDA
jgi:two-component system response regulator AlgR